MLSKVSRGEQKFSEVFESPFTDASTYIYSSHTIRNYLRKRISMFGRLRLESVCQQSIAEILAEKNREILTEKEQQSLQIFATENILSHCLQIDCFKEIIGFSSNSHRQYKETPLEKNIYFGPVPISLVLVQGAFCIFAAPELCPKKRTKLPKLDKKMPIFSRNNFFGECFLCVISIYEEFSTSRLSLSLSYHGLYR